MQFEEFFAISAKIYRIIGRDPLKMVERFGARRLLFRSYGWSLTIYFLCLFVGQASNVPNLLADKSTFILGLASISCEAFCISGLLKEFLFVVVKHKTMLEVIGELKEMFPKNNDLLEEYKAREVLEKTNFRLRSLVHTCYGFIVAWTFYPVLKGIVIYYVVGPPFEKELAFFIQYWYDPYANYWNFAITTVGEFIGGSMAGTFFLSVDLVLLVIIHNCCMHLDYISMKIEGYLPKDSDIDNNVFLDPLVELHIRILKYNFFKVSKKTNTQVFVSTG